MIFTHVDGKYAVVRVYLLQFHVWELVSGINRSRVFLLVEDNFTLTYLFWDHLLFQNLESTRTGLSLCWLHESMIGKSHLFQYLELRSLHLFVVTFHLLAYRRWDDARSAALHIGCVLLLPGKFAITMDLVRINFGESGLRMACARVHRVVIWDWQVYLFAVVIISVLRKDFVEKLHIVENILFIESLQALMSLFFFQCCSWLSFMDVDPWISEGSWLREFIVWHHRSSSVGSWWPSAMWECICIIQIGMSTMSSCSHITVWFGAFSSTFYLTFLNYDLPSLTFVGCN